MLTSSHFNRGIISNDTFDKLSDDVKKYLTKPQCKICKMCKNIFPRTDKYFYIKKN